MLELKLFGKGEVTCNQQSMAGSPSHLPFMLLSYLILNRVAPQNREHIATYFWPDLPPQTARKCLRNAIWRLRLGFREIGANLEDFFHTDDEYVTFIRSSECSIDIELFESAINSCRDIPGIQLLTSQVSQLETAVALYTGDLLEGVFEDWCLSERERLRLLALNALFKLMQYHGQAGNFEKGLAYGQQILHFDNTRENVHRQMMRLFWLAGDRDAAVAQYHRCCQILRNELGIKPMKQTSLLYERLLHNQSVKKPLMAKSTRKGENQNEPSPTSLEQILQELHRLQVMIDGAKNKSRRLEKLIEDTFQNSETHSLGLKDV
jgi:DNA-binding SARP family transcriptional activator